MKSVYFVGGVETREKTIDVNTCHDHLCDQELNVQLEL